MRNFVVVYITKLKLILKRFYMEIVVYIGRMEVFLRFFNYLFVLYRATELFLAVSCFPIVRNMWKHRYKLQYR